ncbi:MAG: hypothetical protein QUS14_15325, partial [Pyrinomonadaceae bacterium]|nr:hypothetical protein [Pyrinomonadaceae bacterium]
MRFAAPVIPVVLCLLLSAIRLGATERTASETPEGPVASVAAAFAVSKPVFSEPLNRKPPTDLPFRELGFSLLDAFGNGRTSLFARSDDTSSLAAFSTVPMPQPLMSLSGLSNLDNALEFNLLFAPADMTGDVGPDHYVQVINALFRVYSKSGKPLTPPARLSSLFASLGTVCSTRNDGLPVVLYDQLADRWIISQQCTAFPPFRQMIAVSKTGDPTGEYYAYEFIMPNNRLNDFPKLGVWSNAYYMSTDEFFGSDYYGSGVFAVDREKMLAGDRTAAYIYFSVPANVQVRRKGFLPADLDGMRAPRPDVPGIFASYTADEYGDDADTLRLFDLRADFAEPEKSTFIERSESPVAVSPVDPTSPDGRADIAQPPPGEFLDSQSDRINYRLAYRDFGTHRSLVVNQTARVTPQGSTYRAGVRVYELRESGQGFLPVTDAMIGTTDASRWVGSAAQDHVGNLAVQYNFASEEKRPSVLYSGRLAGDPPNTFRMEETLVAGTGVQKAFGFRWGEYSGMSVDPVDDCTFWLTNGYYTLQSEQWSDLGWLTQIGTFKFEECSPAPRGRLAGTVRRS